MKSEDTQPQPQGLYRSATQMLDALEDGAYASEVSGHLEDIVRELNMCLDASRRGEATLTLTIKFIATQGAIDAHSSVKCKLPPAQRIRSTFYVAQGQFLSGRNPKQAELELRAVPKQELRTTA